MNNPAKRDFLYPPVLSALFLIILGISMSHAAVSNFWEKRVPLIEDKLLSAIESYKKQDLKSAKKNCDDAYFGTFEETNANMEVAVRINLSVELSAQLEEKFGEIRKFMVQGKQISQIEAEITLLRRSLLLAAKDLDSQQVAPQ